MTREKAAFELLKRLVDVYEACDEQGHSGDANMAEDECDVCQAMVAARALLSTEPKDGPVAEAFATFYRPNTGYGPNWTVQALMNDFGACIPIRVRIPVPEYLWNPQPVVGEVVEES